MTDRFEIQLQAYLEHINADYAAWGNRCAIRQEMIDQFKAGLAIQRGSKYIKIISNWSSVHSFIVIKPDAKYKIGDILKAASWAAPARNKARGNILSGDFSRVSWTGAA